MKNSTRQSVTASPPDACLTAGAVLHDRDGHRVVAHYGSVPGEMAVCIKRVGLADHSDYGAFELRGDRELLDRALIARIGDPTTAIGTGRRLRGVWYLRLGARHALLVGPHAALASRAAIGRGRDHRDLMLADVSASLAIVGVIGPRAARLLAAAGLPGELPIGAIGSDADNSGIVGVLRESQRRFLVLVRADAADACWARLLAAGEPLGAALVGHDALTLLDASWSAAG